MNKIQLYRAVNKRTKIPLEDARPVIRALFEIIAEEMMNGRSVLVPGFFAFEPRHRSGRQTRNPATGAKKWTPGYRFPAARPMAQLKRRMKKATEEIFE